MRDAINVAAHHGGAHNGRAKESAFQSARNWLLMQARFSGYWIVLSVALGLLSGLLLIIQAGILARIVHAAFMKDVSREVLWPFFGLMGAVILFRAALGWGREIAGFYAGAKIRQEIRVALMEHIFSLGPAYTVTQRTGAISSTVWEAVEALHNFYAFYLPQLALAVMIPIAILAFVFPISWAAGGLLLITAPLIPLFMVLVGMGAESVSQKHFQALSRLSGHFLDILHGLATLKLFYRSRQEGKNIAAVSNNFRKKTMRVLRIAFLSSAVLEFFSSIAIALVAVYLAMSFLGYINFGAYGKPFTFAGGFFILLLAPDFYWPLRELGTHYHARAEAVGASKEILKIFSAQPDSRPRGSKSPDFSAGIQVRFHNVHISFDQGRRPVLNGVAFDLRAGEQVALVGASGAGKTTIMNILLGFLQPEQGTVFINGINLLDQKIEHWRQHITWLGQNPVLFHGTIRENIGLGKPQATEKEIEQAAAFAKVIDFCRYLPGGLDAVVGELGLNLSRGQAQRVALARAYLKEAPLLLLDEPTAGLDSDNQALVMDSLHSLSRGRGVLYLTHRLAHIENTDRIMVLENGQITEQGAFANLMASKGKFFQLVNQVPGAKVHE
jgi:ATP-binding cassette subfamily C protein CydD